MKFDIPDGFVVVPLNAVGAPTGIALWCATPEQCEEVFNQEHGGDGNAYLVSCWRSSETQPKPKPSPVKRTKRAVAMEVRPAPARHRVEE